LLSNHDVIKLSVESGVVGRICCSVSGGRGQIGRLLMSSDATSGACAEALCDAKLLGANAVLAQPFTSEMWMKCIGDLLPQSASGKVVRSAADP